MRLMAENSIASECVQKYKDFAIIVAPRIFGELVACCVCGLFWCVVVRAYWLA